MGRVLKRGRNIERGRNKIGKFVGVDGIVVGEGERIGIGVRAFGRCIIEIVGVVVDDLVVASLDDEAAFL